MSHTFSHFRVLIANMMENEPSDHAEQLAARLGSEAEHQCQAMALILAA